MFGQHLSRSHKFYYTEPRKSSVGRHRGHTSSCSTRADAENPPGRFLFRTRPTDSTRFLVEYRWSVRGASAFGRVRSVWAGDARELCIHRRWSASPVYNTVDDDFNRRRKPHARRQPQERSSPPSHRARLELFREAKTAWPVFEYNYDLASNIINIHKVKKNYHK